MGGKHALAHWGPGYKHSTISQEADYVCGAMRAAELVVVLYVLNATTGGICTGEV